MGLKKPHPRMEKVLILRSERGKCMISFDAPEKRYRLTDWKVVSKNKQISLTSYLSGGMEIRLNVKFINVVCDRECVLFIRSYLGGKQNGLLAQKVTIYPDVLPFDLTSDKFIIPKEGADVLKVAVYNDFSSVTEDEETEFLLGKNVKNIIPTKISVNTDSFVKSQEKQSEKPSIYLGDYEPCKKFFSGTICFAQDSNSLWIKDAKYKADKCSMRKNRKLWIPMETAEALFERSFETENGYIEISDLARQMSLYCYTDKFGLGVLSDLPYDYSETKYDDLCRFMVRLLEFECPKAAELHALFNRKSRPSALGYKEEIERAVNLAKHDNRAMYVSEKLISIADEFMSEKVQYKLDRPPETACYLTSIVDYDKTLALYWAYLVTGNSKYIKKLKEHVLAMAQLENWCGEYFYLMTARALITVATAYDFLYDEFSEQERELLAHAMIEKGIKPAFKLYYGHEDELAWPWCIRRTNWNVISNSGIIFAACVLFDEYETDICADAIEKAIQSLEYACIYFAPDGEEFEGLGYAAYLWNYLVFALNALERTFGTAFSLDTSAGAQYAYKIPFTLMTRNGTFSQGDVTTNLRLNTAYTMWWAKRFQDHGIQSMRHMQMKAKKPCMATFTDMLWFDDKAEKFPHFDLDYWYESTQSAISRSGWEKDDAVLSVHAGDNTMEHSHADLGNFDYELLGFRFAQEMGIDDVSYCAPGSTYQLRGHDDYYVARAEGHNVYVINPDRTLGQQSIGQAKVEILYKTADRVLYKVDMESAYRGQVLAAKRYYELKEGRKIFTVQDEIVPSKAGDEVYWFWHTFAHISFKDPMAVEIDDNIVIMTASDGQRLRVQIDCNVPYVLRKGVSIPLETSPNPFDQLQGGMISNLLTVYFKTTNSDIIVRATAWEEGKEHIPGKLQKFE